MLGVIHNVGTLNPFCWTTAHVLLTVNMEDFLKKAPEKVPSLVGVKFSGSDMVDLTGAINVKADHRDDGRFNILFGTDQVISTLLFS